MVHVGAMMGPDDGNDAHLASARALILSSLIVSSAMGVKTQPGLTELTRPLGAMRTISFLSVGTRPYIRADLVEA